MAAKEIELPIGGSRLGGSGGKYAEPFTVKLNMVYVGLMVDNNSGSNEGRKMQWVVSEGVR